MSLGPSRGYVFKEAGMRPIPSLSSDVATQLSQNMTSSNPTEDHPTNTSSTTQDDLAAQSSAGTATTVTSPDTMSSPPADHEPPPTYTATSDTSRRPHLPIPAPLATRHRMATGQAPQAPAAEEAGDGEDGPLVRGVTWLLQRWGPCRRKGMGRFLWSWLGVVLLVLLLNTVLGLAVLLGVHGDKHYAVSPTDTRTQAQWFAVFCSEFTLRGSVPFSAFLLHHPAKVDPHNRLLYTTQRAIQLSGWQDSVDLHYYLLPGSTVTIQTCLEVAGCVDLLVFKGEGNYEQWRAGSCWTCQESAERLTNTGCRNFSYEADDFHTYYFVYTSCQDTPSQGSAHVSLNRSLYDVGDAAYAWVNTTDCVIQPACDWASSVVWQTQAFTPSSPGEDGVVSTSCRYRAAALLVAFGLVPACLALLSCVVVYERCQERPAARRGARPRLRGMFPPRPSDENAPLLEVGLADSPPAYDDLLPAGTPPPSYDEVQRQGLTLS